MRQYTRLPDGDLARRIEAHYQANGSRGTYIQTAAADSELTRAAFKLLDRVRAGIGLGPARRPPFLPRGALAVGRQTAREVQRRLDGEFSSGQVPRKREHSFHLARSYRPATEEGEP